MNRGWDNYIGVSRGRGAVRCHAVAVGLVRDTTRAPRAAVTAAERWGGCVGALSGCPLRRHRGEQPLPATAARRPRRRRRRRGLPIRDQRLRPTATSTPRWSGRGRSPATRSAMRGSTESNTSSRADDRDMTSWRVAYAATWSQTWPWSLTRPRPARTESRTERTFPARRPAGLCLPERAAACGASHLPASTHDTGTAVATPASHSTETFSVRFCLLPTIASPSTSSTGRPPTLRTTSSGTAAPPSSSLTVKAPMPSARGPVRYGGATGPSPRRGNNASGPRTTGCR